MIAGLKCRVVLLAAILALPSCGSMQQNVTPIARLDAKEVCVVENPRVRRSFLDAYVQALKTRGYEARVLASSAQLSACAVVSQYVAIWGFDTIASYLSHADIRVYQKSQPAGRAIYNGNRFVNAEEKVQELVEKLFPQGGGSE
jgi:hypothetical protein